MKRNRLFLLSALTLFLFITSCPMDFKAQGSQDNATPVSVQPDNLPPLAQKRTPSLVSTQNLKNVKVYINPTLSSDWQNAIKDGIRMWEGAGTCFRVTFVPYFWQADLQVHPDTWLFFPKVADRPWHDLDANTAALSDWPSADGKVGRFISLNLDIGQIDPEQPTPMRTYAQKRYVVGHEFGHCIGLTHTNDPNVPDERHIDCTPWWDGDSVMNMFEPWADKVVSDFDKVALQMLYPDYPITKVSLKAYYNDMYMSAQTFVSDDGPLYADGTSLGWLTYFYLYDLGNGEVALRSMVTGKFVCAENDGRSQAVANRFNIGPWETFTRVDYFDFVCFRSSHVTNPKYLRFDGYFGNQEIGPGCMFTMDPYTGN
jgi:hypothetical protein